MRPMRRLWDGVATVIASGLVASTVLAEDVRIDLPPQPDLGRPAFEAAAPEPVKPRSETPCERLATQPDAKAATDVCLSAAAEGQPAAMVALSILLQSGRGGAPDLAGAYQWAELAAATGDARGLYRRAQFFRHGPVGRVDLALWIGALEQAAAAGSIDALRDLADAHTDGIGVAPNADIAADLFLSVVEHEAPRASRGVASAMTNMGRMVEAGVGGVTRDAAGALHFYRKAAAAGDPHGAFAVGRMLSDATGAAGNRTKACDHFERAAGDRHIASMTALGFCYEQGDGRVQDRLAAQRLYEQATAAGDDRAPMLLAQMTIGDAPVDRGRAREWLRTSAERGHAAGMVAYALDLSTDGLSRARDVCDWFERGIAFGSARAMAHYGTCFTADNGGREPDVAAALNWYERAALRGDGTALRNLGLAYLNGTGVTTDQPKALAYMRRGAEVEDASAMLDYGMMLTRGVATAADATAGCDWFERAAKRGQSRAMNNIGACFANGDGRPADVLAGIAWYERAVAIGDMVAMANLGELYMQGRGVGRDLPRAIGLYKRSAEAGHAPAAVELAAALYNGHGLNRDTAAACSWYDRASQSKHPAGLNGLAVCTENGIGRRKDAKAAIALFEKAADAGSLTAYRNLIRLNDRGIGIARNPDTAADWLGKAFQQGYDGLLNDFLAYPSSWSREMRRALQKRLMRDGRYAGPVDGYLSADLDRSLWTMVGEASSTRTDRLVQEFAWAPIDGAPRGLLVRVCKSAQASGRQPLVVINHGLTTDDAERRDMRPLSCGTIASFFAQRGYVVAIPLRRGYGETAGRFSEGGTRICATSPNFIEPGNTIAEDIQATIVHMSKRADVAANGTIVLGHSGGGWGALALASRNAPGFAGFVNISGVHGSNRNRPDGVCGPEPIVRSTREFGRNARSPTLWIYAENDSHAGPRLVRRMFDGYTRQGGNAVLHVLPPQDSDGHNIFDDDSFDLWGGIVDDWLKSLKP